MEYGESERPDATGDRDAAGAGVEPGADPGGAERSYGARSRRLARRLPDLAIEAVAIVLSVLLALALDGWRQERRDRATVVRVIDEVRAEIVHNREAVERAVEYHEPLARNLREGRHRIAAFALADLGATSTRPGALEGAVRRFLERQPLFPEEIRVRATGSGALLVRVADQRARGSVEGDSLIVYGESEIQLRPAGIRNTAWGTAQATGAPLHMDFELVALMSGLYGAQARYQETTRTTLEMLYTGAGSVTAPIQDLLNMERGLLARYEEILAMLGERGRETE